MVRSVMAFFACAFLVATLAGRAGSEPMFELSQCKETAGQSVNLIFRDGRPSRFISFIPIVKGFAIGLELPFSQPFFMEWHDVRAVELKRISTRQSGILTVQLKDQSTAYGMNSFEFGTIDEACWQKLKERFGSDLQFAETDE